MSLKKLLTGKPGNIGELAEMALERGLPVNVFFVATWYPHLTGYGVTEGKTIYSIGNYETPLKRQKVSFKRNLPAYRELRFFEGEEYGACEEILKRLKQHEEQNLAFLRKQGLEIKEYEYLDVQ